MVRRILKIGAVLAVVVIAAIFLLPAFQAPAQGFRTTVIAVGNDGVERVVFSEEPDLLASVVRLQGVAVDTIKWTSTFLAQSPDYTNYTITTGQYTLGLKNPDGTACGPLGGKLKGASFSPLREFQVGIWYSVGVDIIGTGGGETTLVTAAKIVLQVANNGCPTTGTFTLVYTIQIQVEAVGVGAVPTDTVVKTYVTPISLVAGTITLTEDTVVTGS